MKLLDLVNNSAQPTLYKEGNAIMWTDQHISQQLLNVHLNADLDLGSRRMPTIEKTVDWILEKCPNKSLNILDLGCGPGLYTELLAKKGHKVSGVDFSKASIDYAKNEANKKGLDIDYIHSDYLNLDLAEEQFDLVIIIFTDLGVLLPVKRKALLKLIRKVLKDDGTFIFDLLNDNNWKSKTSPNSWEAVKEGFWSASPYLALSESFVYPEDKVILYQHLIVQEQKPLSIYRFWTHFFSSKEIKILIEDQDFSCLSISNEVLPKGDQWNGENVSFCVAKKA